MRKEGEMFYQVLAAGGYSKFRQTSARGCRLKYSTFWKWTDWMVMWISGHYSESLDFETRGIVLENQQSLFGQSGYIKKG